MKAILELFGLFFFIGLISGGGIIECAFYSFIGTLGIVSMIICGDYITFHLGDKKFREYLKEEVFSNEK